MITINSAAARQNGIIFQVNGTTYRTLRKSNDTYQIRDITGRLNLWSQMRIIAFFVFLAYSFFHREQLFKVVGPILDWLIQFIRNLLFSLKDKPLSNWVHVSVLLAFITLMVLFLPSVIIGHLGNTWKYHWVEHVLIDSFEKNGRMPTLDEIKRQSPYSTGCGSTLTAVMLFTILSGIFLYRLQPFFSNDYLFSLVYILGILGSFKLFNYLRKTTRIMTCLQCILLARPAEEMLAGELEAFRQIIQMEESK